MTEVATTKKKKIRFWHLGNTTLRNPFRLKDGLAVLVNSPFHGDLHGKEKELGFARHLDNAEIVNIVRKDEDKAADLGRKWRAALSQLGFISPLLDGEGLDQGWVGPAYTLTKSGANLLAANTGPAIQEQMLRSLAAYAIPSPLEKHYKFARFSPLRHVLGVMLELESRNGNSRLNFLEMALVVQLTNGEDAITTVVDKVLDLRNRREASDKKRKFDTEEIAAAAQKFGYKPGTFTDYADLNLRYLKATGLMKSAGRGVALAPEKKLLVQQFVAQPVGTTDDETYLKTLCAGATLPTDDAVQGRAVLDDLVQQARDRGLVVNLVGRALTTSAEIAVVRHEVEAQLFEDKEREFAHDQAAQWNEISEFMDLIVTNSNKSRTIGTGDDAVEIKVPSMERPAYFEWVLWRAFLAINSLVNPPHKARRFNIDQDFLPVGCAPGGGPDLIFEFADFVVVGEVTLTQSSRQEAAEGEPVRRHVADVVEQYRIANKPVYGLFLANKIDSNTAETFRIGVWYCADDTKLTLDIVPMTLASFRDFFKAIFQASIVDVSHVRTLLDACTQQRAPAGEAPTWKANIAATVAAESVRVAAT